MHGLAVRYRSKEGSIEMKEAVMSGSEKEPKTGKFLGIPYDLRRPTLARLKSRWWNPEEPRLFPPFVSQRRSMLLAGYQQQAPGEKQCDGGGHPSEPCGHIP